MSTPIPPLSDATLAAVNNLVDYTIEAEYGNAVADEIRGARTVALGALQFDLRDQFTGLNGDDYGLSGYADATLRVLIRDGLATRVCQCRQLHATCPHKQTGMPFCADHFEADVPPVRGARLCGTCHVAEYQSAER